MSEELKQMIDDFYRITGKMNSEGGWIIKPVGIKSRVALISELSQKSSESEINQFQVWPREDLLNMDAEVVVPIVGKVPLKKFEETGKLNLLYRDKVRHVDSNAKTGRTKQQNTFLEFDKVNGRKLRFEDAMEMMLRYPMVLTLDAPTEVVEEKKDKKIKG